MARREINNDPIKLIESIFRIRDNKGHLVDYIMAEPHKIMLKTGLLGDRSKLLRIVNKGRQCGFSTFKMIEDITISTLMPNTYQFYVANKEDQAKDWLKDLDKIVDDARLWVDGSRIIDIDSRQSTQLMKVFKHFPKEVQKQIEYSYIVGLAASPGGIRGETAISVDLDEFAWHIRLKDQQRQVYDAVKYFISQGGQMTIQSTPFVRTDLFWKMYSSAKEMMLNAFYFPTIENWEQLDLNKPLAIPISELNEKDLKYNLELKIYKEKTIKFLNIERKCLVQNMIIPYSWVDIGFLEVARRDDLEFFKQENLGIPADVLYRYIEPDLLYSSQISEEKFKNDSGGLFKIALDVAQKRDLTAITVGEFIDNVIWERKIYESQETYPEQIELLRELCYRYKPLEIIIDNTGVGIPIADFLEKDPDFPFIRRIDFSSTIELPSKKIRMTVFLAEGFKKALIDGTYKTIKHTHAESHVLRVEKVSTDSGQIKYTGKKGGDRDDHFWSKSLLAANFDFNLKKGAFGFPRSEYTLGKGGGRLKKLKKISHFPFERPKRESGYLIIG
jgi:hypothetical protein